MISAIILAAIGSTALFSFIQYLITRHDKKTDKSDKVVKDIEELKALIVKIEKDNCRTQMLVLMSDYPEEKLEMMKVSEHYFGDLKGDWYMSSMFNKWLAKNGIEKPTWFDEEE